MTNTITFDSDVIAGHSVEIVALLYSVSLSMSAFYQNNLLLRKACNSSLSFGECTEGEAHAQHVVSVIYSWKALIQYTIPVVLVVLAGPWSDSHGRQRKPLILLPLIGQILTDILCILNVYFWSWPPQIAALFEAVTPGLFGSRNLFAVGILSHISDKNPNELRTLKYGIINAIYTISTLIGTGLAGFLNVNLGFYGAFLVPIVLNLTAISIILIFVKDSTQPFDKEVIWLRPKYLFKSYLTVFKKRNITYTVTLLALLLCQGLLITRIRGEYAVMYLFLRYKFKWYEEEYSYYAAYKMLTIFFGTLFSVTVLSQRLKLHDATIGFIACIFDILAALCYVFAYEPWQLYIIPVVDFFHGTALTVSTSLSAKLVETEELGRTNSVQAIFNTIFMFIIVPMYSGVYNLTFECLTGAVFLLNTVITIPVLIVFVIIYWNCKYLWTKDTMISRTTN